jgi:hypothetical protein
MSVTAPGRPGKKLSADILPLTLCAVTVRVGGHPMLIWTLKPRIEG